MTDRTHLRLLLSALALSVVSACKTTEDFSDFELKTGESEEAKAERMFFDKDMSKPSSFDGKVFEGKEANLRSSFERKEYPEHPYFKLHKDANLRKG